MIMNIVMEISVAQESMQMGEAQSVKKNTISTEANSPANFFQGLKIDQVILDAHEEEQQGCRCEVGEPGI